MKRLGFEASAAAITALGLVSAIAWPLLYEATRVEAHAGEATRVITLTGLAAAGVWTEAEVRGGNYFAREFPPARPVVEVGETVLLRFKSADVAHEFYAPELGIGPIEVYPGHVEEIELTPTAPGAYDFYCTLYCGKPHFMMRGQFVVLPAKSRPGEAAEEYWLEQSPEGVRMVDRGAWLFRTNGCFTCHGREGHGGVRNPNYVKGTVPALDTLAQRMYLYYPEDVRAIVALLERRIPLAEMVDDPPVPRYRAVVAKYESIRDLIDHGNPAGREDPKGPEPPLQMPTWGQRLSAGDIDALIAYLLTLEPADAES